MRGYAETTACRRQFLLGYFGEQLSGPCGNCDTCDSGAAVQPHSTVPVSDSAHTFASNTPVQHEEWAPG
jgi:ATP-dependent DNA helicase RecQ